MRSIHKLAVLGGVMSMAIVILGGVASAHVTVKPAEAVTAGFQTFTVSVPNEKDIPTTAIKVSMPAGLQYVTPTQKAGWQIDVEREGSGKAAKVQSITWSGSEVGAGFRDEFTFSAQVPAKETELQWKAYQTYADGTVVSWNQADTGGDDTAEQPNSGPFSVTKVVAESEAATTAKNTDQVAVAARDASRQALYVGIAGLAVGLFGVYLATRKQQ